MNTQEYQENQDNSAGDDWMFDAVFGFIRSPFWRMPIKSFIEEHCIIFDTEVENKLEYTPIHKQFKQVVEDTL